MVIGLSAYDSRLTSVCHEFGLGEGDSLARHWERMFNTSGWLSRQAIFPQAAPSSS